MNRLRNITTVLVYQDSGFQNYADMYFMVKNASSDSDMTCSGQSLVGFEMKIVCLA